MKCVLTHYVCVAPDAPFLVSRVVTRDNVEQWFASRIKVPNPELSCMHQPWSGLVDAAAANMAASHGSFGALV